MLRISDVIKLPIEEEADRVDGNKAYDDAPVQLAQR